MTLSQTEKNLGISESALKNWFKASKEHESSVPTRSSGNYVSDKEKKIARLQGKLRNIKNVLEVLIKAIGILGK